MNSLQQEFLLKSASWNLQTLSCEQFPVEITEIAYTRCNPSGDFGI